MKTRTDAPTIFALAFIGLTWLGITGAVTSAFLAGSVRPLEAIEAICASLFLVGWFIYTARSGFPKSR